MEPTIFLGKERDTWYHMFEKRFSKMDATPEMDVHPRTLPLTTNKDTAMTSLEGPRNQMSGLASSPRRAAWRSSKSPGKSPDLGHHFGHHFRMICHVPLQRWGHLGDTDSNSEIFKGFHLNGGMAKSKTLKSHAFIWAGEAPDLCRLHPTNSRDLASHLRSRRSYWCEPNGKKQRFLSLKAGVPNQTWIFLCKTTHKHAYPGVIHRIPPKKSPWNYQGGARHLDVGSLQGCRIRQVLHKRCSHCHEGLSIGFQFLARGMHGMQESVRKKWVKEWGNRRKFRN